MAETKAPARQSRYSEVEIDAGLHALALCSGNTRRAAELLKKANQRPVPRETLRYWLDLHAKCYRQVQERTMPELNARMAETHDALVQAYNEIQWEAVEKVHQEMPNIKGSEAANVFKSAAIAAGINTEKAQLRRGEPTEIRENPNTISDLLKLLASPKFRGVVSVNTELIEGTAEEIADGA